MNSNANKKRPGLRWVWRMIYPMLSYYGIYYVVYLLAGILAMTFCFLAYEQGAVGSMDYYTLLDGISAWISAYGYEISAAVSLLTLPAVLYFLRSDRIQAGEDLVRYDRVTVPYYVVVFLLGAAACLAVNGLLYISGLMTAYSEELTEITSSLYRGQLAVELVGTGLLSPVAEELIFRGLCQNRSKEVFSANASILFSALLFALYHGNLLQMIYAFILGLIFGYVYEKYHNLAAPILAHCGANILSVLGSETHLLDRFYASESSLMIWTVVWCILILLCVNLIHSQVNPPELHKRTGSYD